MLISSPRRPIQSLTDCHCYRRKAEDEDIVNNVAMLTLEMPLMYTAFIIREPLIPLGISVQHFRLIE